MTADSPQTILKASELAATVGVALDPADLHRRQQATREADHRAGLKAAIWYAAITALVLPLLSCGFLYAAAHDPSTGLKPDDFTREFCISFAVLSFVVGAIGGWVCGYGMTACPTR